MAFSGIGRFWAAFTTVVWIGCGPAVIFEEERALPNGLWTYANAQRFDYEIQDTAKRYDLILELEHDADFEHQNVYVRLATILTNGKADSQIVSLQLADRFGIWEGDCNKERCTVSIPLQTNTFFPEPGKYALVAEQYGRQDSLSGIYSLGLGVIEQE